MEVDAVHRSLEVRGLRACAFAQRVHIPARNRRHERVPGAMFEQIHGDIPSAHVCGRAQARFPISTSPVPGAIHQRRFLGEQFLDSIQVAVRVSNKILHKACF